MVARDEGERWAASSDAELLAAAIREPEAFGVFYERHARVVLGFFYRRTACAQTSADLTAETFAAAFISRARYRNSGAPARAWLLGIARHELSRSFRRSRLPDRARRRLGIERVAVDDLSYERIEDMADSAALRHAVRGAMATLTPKLAEAVSLRVGLDLPYPEVARRLGTTEGTARARVARGLSHLLDNFGDSMNNSEDIPVLNVLREKLLAGIAERGFRRHRLTIMSAIGGAAAIAVVGAVLLAAQPSGPGHQVSVHGPSAGEPARSDTTALAGVGTADPTTTATATSGGSPSLNTTTSHPAASPTTTTHPKPTSVTTQTSTGSTVPTTAITIVLTVADRSRSLAVARGTIIEVQLDGDSAAIWPTEPTSTNDGVLQRLSGSSSPTSSRAKFVALGPGNAQLTAIGGAPCPAPPPTGPAVGCVAIGIPWSVTLNVG